MNCETTRFTRGLLALWLGYFATAAADWVVLRSVTLPGATELLALGGLYLFTSVSAFVLVSAAESYAIEMGLPVSRAIDAGYALATAMVLWGIGGAVGYGAMQTLSPGSSYAFPVTIIAGLAGALVGGLILRAGRSRRDRSARAR